VNDDVFRGGGGRVRGVLVEGIGAETDTPLDEADPAMAAAAATAERRGGREWAEAAGFTAG